MRHLETKYEIRNEGLETIVLPAATREDAIKQAKELGITDGLVEATYPVLFRICDTGLDLVAEFLKNNHKLGERISNSKGMLYAWAADVENSIHNCGSAQFEIPSRDSVTGVPEICYLDIEEHFISEVSEYEVGYEEIEIV